MPTTGGDIAIYLTERSEISFEDGLFHVRDRSGGTVFHRVMSPHIFLANMERARRAVGIWSAANKIAASPLGPAAAGEG